MYLLQANTKQIDNRSAYYPITSSNIDYAVKAAMCDGKGAAWTEEEQAAARARMGTIGDWEQLIDVTTEEDATSFSFTFKDVEELIVMISGIATNARVNFYSNGMTNFYQYNFLTANNLRSNYIYIRKRLGGMRYVESGSVSTGTPDSADVYELVGEVSCGKLVRSTNDVINNLLFNINTAYILQSGARIQIFGR